MDKKDLDPRKWKLVTASMEIEVVVMVPRNASDAIIEEACEEAVMQAKEWADNSIDSGPHEYRYCPGGWDGRSLVYGDHGCDLTLEDAERINEEGRRLLEKEAAEKAAFEKAQQAIDFENGYPQAQGEGDGNKA